MDFGKEYIESHRPPSDVDLATSWFLEDVPDSHVVFGIKIMSLVFDEMLIKASTRSLICIGGPFRYVYGLFKRPRCEEETS